MSPAYFRSIGIHPHFKHNLLIMTATKFKQRKSLFFLFAVLLFVSSCQQKPSEQKTLKTLPIIPLPVSIEDQRGSFTLDQSTVILLGNADPELAANGAYLKEVLETMTGMSLEVSFSASEAMGIFLSTKGVNNNLGEEGYELSIDNSGITIRGSAKGVFYGIQSLLQLISPGETSVDKITVPACNIKDHPAFLWRGMHLDVSRHFFAPDVIRKYLDLMAMYKLNVFHWHLTDDQGWRIDIEKYSRLTQVGAWREGTGKEPWDYFVKPAVMAKPSYGGYYSKDEVRSIVAYAAERHITIVPEIELPGHSWAALLAYPELSCSGIPWQKPDDVPFEFSDPFCAGNEKTFEFFENVFDEIFELFPSEYIHIGGDECKKTPWEHCEKCQKRMEEENLESVEELQSYFVKRIESYVQSKGRKIIGWDEILEGGLAPEASVMSWRGEEGGIEAARQGHHVVMTPGSYLYLNRGQYETGNNINSAVLDLKTVYHYNPVPESLSGEEAQLILGAQGCLWSENLYSTQILEEQLMPRMTALSEMVWTTRERKNWTDYKLRLEKHFARLDKLSVQYAIPPPAGLVDDIFTSKKYTVVLNKEFNDSEIRYTINGDEPDQNSELYLKPIIVSDNTVLKAKTFFPLGRSSETVVGSYKNVKLVPPIKKTTMVPGLDLSILKGDITSLEDFSSLQIADKNVVEEIAIPENVPADFYGLAFEGVIDIPKDGIYTFYTSSDDGSRLYLDGRLLVDNDGIHGMIYRSGKAALKKGPHPITILFFDNRYGEGLLVEMEGPEMDRQTVPGALLYHTQANN